MPKRRANGEGNIRKRKDGRWEGRYTAGYDANGKVITKNVLGRTQAEVKDKLRTAIEDSKKLDPVAAFGSGFSLQAAFWYQNAMLALFLRSKKSQKCSPILIPLRRIFCFSFCTSHEIQHFCAPDVVVATLVAM